MAASHVGDIELGNTISAEAGEAISAGELVTLRLTDGKAYLACAATGLEDLPAMGIATCDVALGHMGSFITAGPVRGLPTTVDGFYYTSNTPGAISATAGNTSQKVAWAIPGSDGVGMLDITLIAHSHPSES